MKRRYVEAVLVLYCALISVRKCSSRDSYPRMTDEMRLHSYLFPNGSLTSFPIANGQIRVTMGLTLNQIVDVEETEEALVMNIWIRQKWVDPRLTWKRSSFSNISKINIRPALIWTPDIYSYSNLEDDKKYNGFLNTMKTPIVVNSTGHCTWLSSLIVRVGCAINVRDFPFDTQNCSLKFGSFTYDLNRLDVRPESPSADLKAYSENIEWNLLSMWCFRSENLYHFGTELRSDVTYELVIKRKPLFLLMNLIFPNIIFSSLTVVVYLVPVTAGERSTFVINLLLAMALFLTSALSLMPTSSEAISFSSYFLGMTLITMFLLTICLCYTLTIHYANAGEMKMPKWMRIYILEGLTSYFGLEIKRKRPRWRKMLQALDEKHSVVNKGPNSELYSDHPGRLWSRRFGVMGRIKGMSTTSSSPRSPPLNEGLEGFLTGQELKEISRKMSKIIENIEERDQGDWDEQEWHTVARTLDKLSFYIFAGAYFLILFSCGIRICMIP